MKSAVDKINDWSSGLSVLERMSRCYIAWAGRGRSKLPNKLSSPHGVGTRNVPDETLLGESSGLFSDAAAADHIFTQLCKHGMT